MPIGVVDFSLVQLLVCVHLAQELDSSSLDSKKDPLDVNSAYLGDCGLRKDQ